MPWALGVRNRFPDSPAIYRKAAEANNAEGLYLYALTLQRGLGVSANTVSANSCLRAAAALKHPQALNNLCKRYATDTAHAKKFHEWALTAARIGNGVGANVAVAYLRGWGLAQTQYRAWRG